MKQGSSNITIDELSDFNGSLARLKEIVDDLVEQYGKYSTIKVDAGYNNVEFNLSIF